MLHDTSWIIFMLAAALLTGGTIAASCASCTLITQLTCPQAHSAKYTTASCSKLLQHHTCRAERSLTAGVAELTSHSCTC